uniref:Hydrophobic seed protein domain-containing protein n=1 Tax=Oryza barthii TaxID=65489 RepID=A0A0D3HCL5_9ORYZ
MGEIKMKYKIMASKVVASFLALSLLLFAVTAHGCTPNCSSEKVIPTPPEAVPAPLHPGGHSDHGRCPINALKLRVCANVLKGWSM